MAGSKKTNPIKRATQSSLTLFKVYWSKSAASKGLKGYLIKSQIHLVTESL